uniref:Uncharacterized protein n=1 Tax=viral metagenome TaxID=1070528 RepID=A0A6M3LCN6_9ZZZZ
MKKAKGAGMKKTCENCILYEQDYTCRGLADWLGMEFAEGCGMFQKIEDSVVVERCLECWR